MRFTYLRSFLLIGLLVIVSVVIYSRYAGNHMRVRAASPIQHIVFILKENRTFDNYFGAFPGVNGTTTGLVKVNGSDKVIALNPFQDVSQDYGHAWANAHTAYDHGAMDQFNQGACQPAPYSCYQEAHQSDIPNYWAYAQHYLLNDNAFSDIETGSFPNHMDSVAGASGPDLQHSAINNPHGGWGCDAPSNATVQLFNGSQQYPCFNVTTLADEMTAAGVSWKFYAAQKGQAGFIWNSLDDFNQDRNGSAWANDVSWQQFATDATNNTLPAFSWLVPPSTVNEHAGLNRSVCVGENWTVQQINAVMQSPAWSSTVIVVAWDDFGGWYDHAAPPSLDALGYGFRVPFLVISPYAYATDNPSNPHVGHTQLGFGSVLRLAEEAFGLPSLGKRDATSGDLMTELDFSQVHNPAMVLQQRSCSAGPSNVTPENDTD